MTPPDTTTTPADAVRDLVAGLVPFDDHEAADRDDVLAWIDGGADLYRRVPPDVPPKHLVTYFPPYHEPTDRVFLVDHRKAGRLLPPGHVEPGEHPWATVVREAGEELQAFAVAHPLWPDGRPLFVTVTCTVGAGVHTDVTLWFLLALNPATLVRPDRGEFTGWGWYPRTQVAAWPAGRADPELPRFLGKIGQRFAAIQTETREVRT